MDVSIVIPTFRRPHSLRRALGSCSRQVRAPNVELVVVDNCPDASAREIVRDVAANSPFPMRYEHEPRAGVASARNAGVAAAKGSLIAFLDDDNEAAPDWLASLVHAHSESGADAVFGSVIAELEGQPPPDAELYLTAFRRVLPEPPGPVRSRSVAKLGTGNALFAARALGCVPFNPSLNFLGGEDTALIKRFVSEKRRLFWAPDARVREYVPVERANLRFLLKRRFSAGQVRTATCVLSPAANPADALRWMAVGAIQFGVFSALAAAASVLDRSAANRFLCEAAGGLGKVLWMSPFRVQRYPSASQRTRAVPAGEDTAGS
jgi:glycosyltransferase involved in cell wall biosynthesis